jgi:CRP/FNR family transcriptional regulator, cyclic AMP receptor protein
MGKSDGSKDETKALAAALAKVDLFADLCRRERFGAGQVIVSQGTDSSRFYLLTQGEVVVKVNDRPIASMGPGEYFGEISMIDRGLRTASVVAVSDVVAYSLAFFSFRPLLKENPEMAIRMLVTMCERVRRLESALTI